jgi:hypothetical protein
MRGTSFFTPDNKMKNIIGAFCCAWLLAGCEERPERFCFEGDAPICFEKAYTKRVRSTVKIEAADLDLDGDAEVIEWGPNGIWIVDHQAGDNFKRKKLTSLEKKPLSLLAEDVNGDGLRDIIFSLQREGEVPDDNEPLHVFLNQGDSEFTELSPRLFPRALRDVQKGDFNNDSVLDLAAMTFDETIVGEVAIILLGNGDGTFEEAARVSLKENSRMTVTDLDQDQFSDLLIIDSYFYGGSLLLLRNQRDSQTIAFENEGEIAQVLGSQIITIADVNENNQPDILIRGDLGTLQILRDQNAVLEISGLGSAFISVDDFNGDQRPDLIASSVSRVEVFLAQGDGNFFELEPLDSNLPDAYEHRFADVNGDSRPDLVIEDFNTTTIYLSVP